MYRTAHTASLSDPTLYALDVALLLGAFSLVALVAGLLHELRASRKLDERRLREREWS